MKTPTHEITILVHKGSEGWRCNPHPRYLKDMRDAGYTPAEDRFLIAVDDPSIVNVKELPRPINVGDLVTWGTGDQNYLVQFIDGDKFAMLVGCESDRSARPHRIIKPVYQLRHATKD